MSGPGRVAFPLLILCLVLVFHPARGEDEAVLDLQMAYQLAVGHDAGFAAARAARDAGLEKLPQGRAPLLPSLTLDSSAYQYSKDSPPLNDQYGSNGYGLTLSQPLYRPQDLASYRQARSEADNARAAYAQAQYDLILRLARAYFDVLTARESLSAAKAKTAALYRSLAQARRRFEVGKAIVTEIDEAQARYDLARAEQIAADNELQLRKESLTKLIGRRPARLATVRQDIPLQPLQPRALSAWEEMAEKNAPGIRIARNNYRIATNEVSHSRGGYYPTLDLVASYRRDTSSGVSGGDSDTALTSLGLKFQLPLYSGGGTSARVREAIASQEQARQQLRDAREQALLEARQAYMSVTSGRLRLQALNQALRSSESSLQATRRGFKVGKRTLLDVLNAEQQLFETRRDLAAARYGYLYSLLQLKSAVGVVSVADVEAVNRFLSP